MAAGPPPSRTIASIRPSDVPDTVSFEPPSTRVTSLTIVNRPMTASCQGFHLADGAVNIIRVPAQPSAKTCTRSTPRPGWRGPSSRGVAVVEAIAPSHRLLKPFTSNVSSRAWTSLKAQPRGSDTESAEKKTGRSAATNPPANDIKYCRQSSAAVVHENSFSRAKTRGVGRFMHAAATPYQTPRGARLPAAVLSGLPGPTAQPIRGFAFCHLDIRPVDLSCLKMVSGPSTAQIQADLPS